MNNNVLQQECPSGVSAWSCEKCLLKVSSTVSHTTRVPDGAPKSVQGDGHLFGPSQPSRASSFLDFLGVIKSVDSNDDLQWWPIFANALQKRVRELGSLDVFLGASRRCSCLFAEVDISGVGTTGNDKVQANLHVCKALISSFTQFFPVKCHITLCHWRIEFGLTCRSFQTPWFWMWEHCYLVGLDTLGKPPSIVPWCKWVNFNPSKVEIMLFSSGLRNFLMIIALCFLPCFQWRVGTWWKAMVTQAFVSKSSVLHIARRTAKSKNSRTRFSYYRGAFSKGRVYFLHRCDLRNEPAMLQSESKETSNNVTLQCFLCFLHVAVRHTGTVQVDGPAFAGFKNLATHEELGPGAMHGNCNRVQCDRGDYQNMSNRWSWSLCVFDFCIFVSCL